MASVEVEDIVGAHEVRQMLGVSHARFYNIVNTKKLNFPSPVRNLLCGPIYDRRQILEFLSTWDRTPGRRRSE